MDWLTFVVQWLHVLLAIFWFGAALYSDFILIPALSTLPISRQREAGGPIGARAARIIVPVAGLVILLGILRGTVFGPIKSVDYLLGSAYGLTWLFALVVALGTFYWSFRVIVPAINRMNRISVDEAVGPDGAPAPSLVTAIAGVKRAVLLELGGFVVIFTCMILMRFGL
jgi:uncharacterized membrane protein